MLNTMICPNLFIAILPFRLMLEIAAFIASLFASILGLGVPLFALFAQFDAAEFHIGQQRNGFMPLGFNTLVSLIQFPVLINHALNLYNGEISDWSKCYFDVFKMLPVLRNHTT